MDDAQARRVQASIDSYVRAWNSNDPADIRASFICPTIGRSWWRGPAGATSDQTRPPDRMVP
jgi:hypothetical protein